MRILLIKPKWFVHGGVYRFLEDVRFTPLHIAIIAALSDGHEVRLCDNDWEEIPWDEPFDLVGITAATFTSQRAYELAGQWRTRGAKVVLGGVHASLEELKTLPREIQKKILCHHYSNDFKKFKPAPMKWLRQDQEV